MGDVMTKIGVIGAGGVGSAALLSLVVRGSAREIVVLNRNRKRASAVATDCDTVLRYLHSSISTMEIIPA